MGRIKRTVITDKNKIAAFTGYRPQKLSFGNDLSAPDALALRKNLEAEYMRLIKAGYRKFLTGGAQGCDLMAAEVILELRIRLVNEMRIEHVVCLPCFNYTKAWDEEQRRRLKRIIDDSNGCHYVSCSEYYKGCMQVRNRYMVDNSSLLLAVYDGQKGGTANTVAYARQQKKKVIVIHPRLLTHIELIEGPEDTEKIISTSAPLNYYRQDPGRYGAEYVIGSGTDEADDEDEDE